MTRKYSQAEIDAALAAEVERTKSVITEEEYQAQVKATRLAMLSEEQYLELLFRDGLELEAQIIEAEDSFRAYAKLMWPVMEAGQPMVTGWATDAMCDHLQAVTEDEIEKLAIFVPPGMAKSALTCVYWPTWEWGPRKMAWLRYITASYSEDLTLGTNRLSRALIDSDIYMRWWRKDSKGKDLWGIDSKQDSKTEFQTTLRGMRFATSTGGTITGKRGHRLIFDDLHSASQAESDLIRQGQVQWFKESAQNRVVDAKAKKVLIMQRLHEADVGGRAIEMGWTVLCLPMRYEHDHPLVWVKGPVYETLKLRGGDTVENLIRWGDGDPRDESRGGQGDGELLFPERFPKKYVDLQEEEMDEYAVAGQNQQSPQPRGGGQVKVDLIEIVEFTQVPDALVRARGWDLASSKKKGSAFTACVKGGLDQETGYLYFFDAQMERKGPGELDDFIKEVVENDEQSVLESFPKDPAQAGDFQAHHLSKNLVGRIFEFTPETGDKVDRFKPVASLINAGKVRFVRGPWNDKLKNQMKKFPTGKFKDLCDASSRMLMAITLSMPEEDDPPGAPTVISIPNPDERLALEYRTR